MANPYEEVSSLLNEGVQEPEQEDSNIESSPLLNTEDTTKVAELPPPRVEVPSSLAGGGTNESESNETSGTSSDVSEPSDSNKFAELRSIKRDNTLSREEKEAAIEAWSMKHHGVDWQTWKQQEQENNGIANYLTNKSVIYRPEQMSAIAAGTVDFFQRDVPNLFLQGKNKIPSFIPKFESEGAQSLRNVSSLIVPFFILKGKGMQAGAKVHSAKVAPIWLQRLGNNPAFSRFSKVGLDLGVGGAVDYTAQTSQDDDTLATSWKRGKWWGHSFIPESWTSDNLAPDGKRRANVLEGIRLGFYTSVAEGAFKLARAGTSIKKTTKYLAANSQNQGKLNKYVDDPLDTQIFDDDPVTDNLLRQEAKYDREVKKLTAYHNVLTENPSGPTVGIHKIKNQSEAGIIPRSSDGIIGAAKDQTLISKNLGTVNGRLSNLLSDAARKFGLNSDAVTERAILKNLRKNLLDIGEYDVNLPNGKRLSWKEIDREGKILAEVIADPTLPKNDLVRILNNFKETVNGVKKLNPVGYKAVSKAMIRYLDDWADINMHKARAYLLTSEAGQISDLSEGMRYIDGSEGITRANEQLLDRLELFELETSISDFEWKSRNKAFESFKQAIESGDQKSLLRKLDLLNENYNEKLTDIISKSKEFRATLADIQVNNPEFAKSLRLAYELSDGNVQTIKGINRTIENMLGTYSKAVVDGAPEIPSIFNRAVMTNIFNSMLSAVGTPIRALQGNFGGFISEPVSVLYGALREGDTIAMRRASHMYFGIADTFQLALPYAGRIFRKASMNPDEVQHLFRNDLAIQKARNMEFAQEFARAASEKGEYGAQTILNLVEELEALGRNPVLRFGPNAMTGLDGLTEATQKIAQDKGQAFDELLKRFPDGNWTKEDFRKTFKKIWDKNWTEDGLINQKSVEYAKREIALNLDTPLVRNLNPILKRFPVLRSIFWFPTTQMNALDMFGKYGNFSRVKIGTDFTGEYSELLGPYGQKKITDFRPDEIRQILAKRGMDMTGDVLSKINHLRYKIRGRVAIGNTAIIGAGLMVSQDRIRGNGHWDRQIQKTRLSQGWKPLTYKGLDGNWHSYEWLGPLAKWMGLVVDGFDNFDSMSTTTLEKFEKKMAFVLGAAITDDSFLSNLEPVFSILSGNPAARNRWLVTMTNAAFPGAGFRNELGKNMYGMLREVEQEDIGQLMRNRNNWLDSVDPEGAQPAVIDWVTGRPVPQGMGSWFGRVKNTMTGFKTYPGQTPQGQFLIDIEFDSIPHFTVSSGGVQYTVKQKEELGNLMGKDGFFKKQLAYIMNYAEKLTYTDQNTNKTYTGYVNIMRYFREMGLTGEEFDDYGGVKSRLDSALGTAKRRVELQLSDADEIRAEESDIYRKEQAVKRGDSLSVFELIQPTPMNN